jgi:hypothetical protein
MSRKQLMKGIQGILVGLLLASVGAPMILTGCSAGTPDKPESIASDARVKEIVRMREIFDKVGGKWDALSPEDKAEYTRLAGDEAKAKTFWSSMANPYSSGAPQGR